MRMGATRVTLAGGASMAPADYVNSELPWHNAVRDSQNQLLAWFHPDKNQGYDKVDYPVHAA
jgi:hypothetical protein